MKHFLSYVEESIKRNWSNPAISNYGAATYTFGEIAEGVAKWHIFFEKCGVKKGDHIAICSRNSAEWCVAFIAVVSYEAVAVPLLADFLPENIMQLTEKSDSRMLLVDDSALIGFERAGISKKIVSPSFIHSRP